jgi:hypothetical protein
MTAPETTLHDTAAEFHRRRRGRNIAMLVVLLALSGLFFAIAVVKMSRTGIG